MKSMLCKKMREMGVSKIGGKKIESYSFYALVGFMTRINNGEDIK